MGDFSNFIAQILLKICKLGKWVLDKNWATLKSLAIGLGIWSFEFKYNKENLHFVKFEEVEDF